MNNEKKNYVSPTADFLSLGKEDILTASNYTFSSNKKENDSDEKEGKWYTPFVKW